MSVISDRVRQIDAQLNRIPFSGPSGENADTLSILGKVPEIAAIIESPRVKELIQITQKLSVTPSASSQLSSWQLQQYLEQSGLTADDHIQARDVKNHYQTEVEWRLVSKAALQTFGLVMETLLQDNINLQDDLWYWNEVLSSYRYCTIYAIQNSPVKLWTFSREIYAESRARLHAIRANRAEGTVGSSRAAINGGWNHFYNIVKETIHERTLNDMSTKLMTPFAQAQAEAQEKRKQLKRMRYMTASGLGVLMDEGLVFNGTSDDQASTKSDDGQDWKSSVEKTVALIDTVLENVLSLKANVTEFEERVFSLVQEDSVSGLNAEDFSNVPSVSNAPAVLAKRLHKILSSGLIQHSDRTQKLLRVNGKPGVLVRWWLPAGIAIFSSGAILRILTNRRAEIIQWIRDLGITARDFYLNWVVDPITKLIRTIRHDEKSEFAIMSRDSLKADLESLERMVVDFAVEKPQFAVPEGSSPSALSEIAIAEIQAKVAEGDVTPVLRAYEQNIRRPFLGTVRGDLVRALLIQVQQTKVDVKVALSGIDSLLKSQELVFGFVGLTPGILVSVAVGQYVAGFFSSGGKQTGNSRKGVMILRNIDRILANAGPDGQEVLSYKEHGLLLCEIHLLRNLVGRTGLLPRGEIEECFLQDVEALANGKIAGQKAALDRIRWTYSRWLRS